MQLNVYFLNKSNAKSIGFIISETCSMSLIYKMKSNGPNIDPCGTPQEISLYSDSLLLNTTYCFLLCK